MILDKKGIALETSVALIIGIVFLIVIIYILLQTGMLSTFQMQFYGLMCTASSYSRGIFIGIILWIWTIASIAITVVLAISGASKGAYMLKQTSTKLLSRILKQAAAMGAVAGVISIVSFLSLTVALVYVAIIPLTSGIPLICPAVTIDLGSQSNPATSEKFLSEVSASTIDCWNMYGAGSMDPLFAIDPPNPRECRTIESYIVSTTPSSPKQMYDYLYAAYNQSWPLGNSKLFAYCVIPGSIQNLGNNPADWAGECSFDKARIYIMFRDKHDYDLVAYGTAVCNGIIDAGDFGDIADAMVWCIEPI